MRFSKAAVRILETWRARCLVSFQPAAAKVAGAQAVKEAVLVAAALHAQMVVAAAAAEAVQQARGANASGFRDPFLDKRPLQTQVQGFDVHLIVDHTTFHSAQPTGCQ